jgi:hypothetical protein
MLSTLWPRPRTRTGATEARNTSKPTRRKATFRPQLEALDDRLVPAKVTPAPTPTTWVVTNNLDSGTGSLRAEIAAANPGDIIDFAPGLAGQTIQLTSDELFISKSLTIQGPGAGLLTISGGNVWRDFEVAGSNTAGPTVLLSGLTITGGKAHALRSAYDGYGGGIVNDNGSTLTISGCIVSNNRADLGGGGVGNVNDATLKVVNSTLSGNTASNPSDGGKGGAVYCIAGGSMSLTGCSLFDNTSYVGGAIYVGGTTTTVSGCIISENYTSGGVSGWMAPGEGSAIYNAGTATTLKNGRTTTNLTVSNSTFSGNYVTGIPTDSYPPITGPWANGGGNTFG